MRWCAAFTILCICSTAVGQSVEASSRWEAEWKRDSLRGDAEGIYHLLLRLRNSGEAKSDLITYCDRALEIYRMSEEVSDSITGRTYVFKALELGHDRKEAIRNFERALFYYKRFYPPGHNRIHSVYFHLAEKNRLISNIDDALLFLDSALSLQWTEKKVKNWPRSLNLLGSIYAERGDLGKCELIFALLKPYLRSFKSEMEYYHIINTHAEIYSDNKLLNRAVEVLNPIIDSTDRPFYTYSMAGQVYLNLKQYDSAIHFFERQIPHWQNESPREKSWVLSNLSECYFEKGDLKKAMQYFNRIDFSDVLGLDTCLHLLLKAKIFSGLQKNEDALKIYHSIEEILLNENSLINPFYKVQYCANYLDALYTDNESEYADEFLLDTYDLVMEFNVLLQALRLKISSPLGRQNFMKYAKRVYDKSIKICQRLYVSTREEKYLALGLRCMEANKALVLTEEIAEKRSNNSRKLQYRDKFRQFQKLLNAESNLDKQLALSDSIYFWLAREERDTHLVNQHSGPVTDLTNFKEFFQPGKAFANYFQHFDSTLSIIILENGKANFYSLDKLRWYGQTFEKISKLGEHTSQLNSSDGLWKILIPWDFSPNTNEVVIIPDGLLNQMPFEDLTDSSGSRLIEHYAVSYSFSLQMIKQMESFPPLKGRGVIFAPRFEDESNTLGSSERGDNLDPLLYNRSEAGNLADLLSSSQLFLNGKANVDNFNLRSPNSNFIHIATHAFTSLNEGEEARIFFDPSLEENTVSLSDIYYSTIPTNMVVMSACETAIGQYIHGEGVMSFARAFTAAGSKSVIASLWAVNDQSTAEIMLNFYQYLKKGFRKDHALRRAKLDYINSADPAYKDPYYWAGFIAIGDMSPIANKSLAVPIFICLFILLVLGLIYRKRFQI